MGNWAEIQTEMRQKLEEKDRLDFCYNSETSQFEGLQRVAGLDISYPTNDDSPIVALVVLSFPGLQVLYEDCWPVTVDVPYVPGYLGFRESVAYQQMYNKLQATHPELLPQVTLVDGNGTLHPRRFGSACHLGVLLDIPTVGVAKSFLHIEDLKTDAKKLKRMFKEQPQDFLLKSEDEVVYGMAVSPDSTGGATNPIFVSVGHRVSLEASVALARACSKGCRIPEPIRMADQRSREMIRQLKQ